MSPTRRFSKVVRIAGLAAVVFLGTLKPDPTAGQTVPASEAAAESDRPDGVITADDTLSIDQQQIADKYKRLEDTLLRMAELTAVTDPRRAALLKKAVAQSKGQLIGLQLNALAELLEKGQLSRAMQNQEDVDADLRALLELLLSENRAKRIESEKARIRNYLKQLNQIIRMQKDVQGRTAGGQDQDRLADEQDKLADSSGGLADAIKRNEEADSDKTAKEPSQDSKPGEKDEPSRKGGGDTQDGQKSDEDKGDEKPSEGKEDPSEEAPEEKEGQPAEQENQEGDKTAEPTESQSPEQEGHPARNRIEAATKRMRAARQKLQQAQRDGAVQEQEEAIRELEQAKAELEEILRQLREEEIEQVLTMLQARFVKMLEMQRAVHEGTCRLDEASKDGITHGQEIEASRLSSQETEIVLEAEKALTLLREEGSAVAMPEALGQIRDDMRQVAGLLAKAKLGRLTQETEEDIMAALEEMLEAMEVAQKDADQRRNRPPPDGEPGEPQDPSLVDMLAEIRMIRALQLRINKRTERYAKLISGDRAENAEVLEALHLLAERQKRIHQITRDLERGMDR